MTLKNRFSDVVITNLGTVEAFHASGEIAQVKLSVKNTGDFSVTDLEVVFMDREEVRLVGHTVFNGTLSPGETKTKTVHFEQPAGKNKLKLRIVLDPQNVLKDKTMADNTAVIELKWKSKIPEDKRTLVYYSQEDSKWKNTPFTVTNNLEQTIGTSGCGPTSMAMAISSLTGKTVLPPEICAFAVANGFRTANSGVSHALISAAARQYGLSYEKTSDIEHVMKRLEEGAISICALGPGHFTYGGHFIVLYDVVSTLTGKLISIMDPNPDNTAYQRYGTDNAVVEDREVNDGFVRAKVSVIDAENRLKVYHIVSV